MAPLCVALASTVAPSAMNACVSLVIVTTPTDMPMPAPAMPMPSEPATMTVFVWSLAATRTLLPACTVASPIDAQVWRSSTITDTAPPTPTDAPPAMPAATEMTLSVAVAATSTSRLASICTELAIDASVLIVTTRMSAPGATDTPPLIAIAPATPSWL